MNAMNLALVALIGLSSSAIAGSADPPPSIDGLRDKGYSVTSVTPIFSQLLKMSYPRGFVPTFEKANPASYIQESVPRGEDVTNWKQMITLTGYKDLAAKPNMTPKAFLNGMAAGFQRACPNSYGVKLLSEAKLSGFDAAVAVVSCGVSPTTAGKTSESALIAVLKGQADVYTIQWAERGTPSNVPIQIDVSKWQERFNLLNPIKLCPIIAGEKAPYPSCTGGARSPA